MKNLLLRFMRDDSGHALEYAVLVTGIALTVIPATNAVGTRLQAVFEKIAKALH
jgi:Flp pilus assembly pilin Flp